MRARPMIMAVWMRAAAPGWRAIASTAEATARPWPRAHRPAANAMAKPATRTEYGPIKLPPAGASAARARPGIPRTTRAARVSERRTTASSVRVVCLVMRRLVLAAMVLGFLDRARDIEHREHDEEQPLEKRDQALQRIQKADREGDHHGPADSAHDG